MSGDVRLVEWDALEVRINGARIRELARPLFSRPDMPIEDLNLEFSGGELRVAGKVRKVMAIPFRFVVRRIQANGPTVAVPLEDMSAFGFIPVPALLTRLVGNRQAGEGISFDSARNTVLIQLDRFLPRFVDVEVDEIRIIDGGLLVRLGRGGADLPTSGEGPWKALQT